ncbi:hypothetical protein GCM10010313_00430 [Streptomyces violarus]|uniref:Uncharacterized protein n=1 Tax=Streptomyces violarus TaxID=67380 RepID=A0A7W5EYM6_9ACTN|nr:hypothetical protein [Streptomyces violarus]GHC95461.1 hypothetical protein GCM10010313_00430 [Streptomyces violarus]
MPRAARATTPRPLTAPSGDRKAGDLYLGGKLTFNKVVVDRPGTYQVKVAYVSGDARPVEVSANGGEATSHEFPSTGDRGTVETVSVPVTLKAGADPIPFDSGSGYAPDIDLTRRAEVVLTAMIEMLVPPRPGHVDSVGGRTATVSYAGTTRTSRRAPGGSLTLRDLAP